MYYWIEQYFVIVIIEAENNFLLESIAACDPDNTDADLEMYFMANKAFLIILRD